ncbi:MAG: uracil-DNA glycosylase [Acidobacteriota bacterium]|nr:uracil-DNA glycosylase [Acidobacteriota bacterium]
MTDEKLLAELLDLTREAGEHLAYLRELGIEGIEMSAGAMQVGPESQSPATTRRLPKPTPPPVESNRYAALKRNAEAGARKFFTPPPSITPAMAQPPAGVKQTFKEQGEEMAKRKPVRAPAAVPPAPQETLFGEIKPKDELSLPRSGETFEDIYTDIGECVRCPLHKSRTQIVNSDGNRQARLMFVGEAPGADEDAQGRPFVGRAGQLLNKIIEAIGLKREDVFIGNVNRCRPPANRTPTHEEAATCKPFLLREIAILQPEVIVVLGNTAMKNLLDTKEGITKLRGQFMDYNGIKVMPTFHPAYLLRDPSKKRETWDDMKKVRDYLNANKK